MVIRLGEMGVRPRKEGGIERRPRMSWQERGMQEKKEKKNNYAVDVRGRKHGVLGR